MKETQQETLCLGQQQLLAASPCICLLLAILAENCIVSHEGLCVHNLVCFDEFWLS